MAKTALDCFKGGRNVKYLREAWIWGFKCALPEGAETTPNPPSPDEIWEWFAKVGVPSVVPSDELEADDGCSILTSGIQNMSLEVQSPSPKKEKKKPGRPKKEKKKKAKKAKNPKLSKPLLRAVLQDLELVEEDDKSDLKTLQEVYKEHYNSLLDEKGFVDEEKEGEFALLMEKMSEEESKWAEKQAEKKAKKEKKKAESSDDSAGESDGESEKVGEVMNNPLVQHARMWNEEPVDASIPAPHPESIEAKRREKAAEEKQSVKVEKVKGEKKPKKKKAKKDAKHKWKGGVKDLREFLTEKGVEFDKKDKKPVLAELYERFMDCEERKAEAEAENTPEMLQPAEEVGNPLASPKKKVEETNAAKVIQNAWKGKLQRDESPDIELPGEETGYEPLSYEGVNYQVDKETMDVMNMDGTKVGELENGIVIFDHPYDDEHAAKANAEVSDSEDSGEETEDMSDEE